MKILKLILLIIFLLIIIILFFPQPYIGMFCSSDNPVGYCNKTQKILKYSNSIYQKVTKNQKTNKYPQYGYAPDFSWVAGKVEFRGIEGGCFYIDFDNNPPSWEGSKLPYGGRLALGIEQGYRFNLEENPNVIIFGKLGESKFSMACPPQNYIIEKVIKR